MNAGPERFQYVRGVVTEAYPDADIYAPKVALQLWSLTNPWRIVDSLLADIDALVERRGSDGYEEIMLIGHSAGAVLARAVWCLAHGGREDGEVKDSARPWAHRISRLTLLAAVNRGFSLTTAMAVYVRLGFWLASLLEAFTGSNWTMMSFRRGAPFLTTVRLLTLSLNRKLKENPPIIVQVLGTIDDFVSPSDNVDLLTGASFYYLTAPHSSHVSVLRADPSTTEGEARRRVILQALAASRETLDAVAESAEDLEDLYQDSRDDFDETPGAATHEHVDHVVFVIHGIRDYGFWTKKLAAEVKRQAKEAGKIAKSVTSSYGYFPMGPFILPVGRREKVEWLLDQYVHARALYPGAPFSYIGHSNGTYLLANALDVCPAIRFEHVVFAGSVVRRDHDWRRPLTARQIRQVLNFTATTDWVVAIFPNFLQALRYFGLGSAGHNGFKDRPPEVIQVGLVAGAHDAAIKERRWPEIAKFILTGDPPPLPSHTSHPWWIRLVGFAPWLVVGLLLLVLVAVLQLILGPLGVRIPGLDPLVFSLPPHLLWLPAVELVVYAWVLRRILTKV